MEMTCESLKDSLKGVSLVQGCDVIKNGMVRIETPFKYPNGAQIDLFIGPASDLFSDLFITDLGQTTSYLLDLHIRPWLTRKRKRIIENICAALDVEQKGGAFQVKLPRNEKNASGAIVQLAQACIRVADLAYTQRFPVAGSFVEEIEEFIAAVDLPYDTDVELAGDLGNVIKVDFRVKGHRVESLIETLSTSSPSNAHARANEVFTRLFDLQSYRATHQVLTVYDSTMQIYKAEDLLRLEKFSQVFGFPQESEQLQEAIAA
jgi:hypothetical protein